MSMLPKIQGSAYARWLLPVSLALNICFVGAASAVAYRYTGEVPLSVVELVNFGAMDRLDRVATALPSSDAQVMRDEIRSDEERIASAQADLRLTQDEVRNTLRAEPFNLDAMRAAMQKVQTARENYHNVIQSVLSAAAPKMSVVGRNKLASLSAVRGNVSP
jgi:hypothetical protein